MKETIKNNNMESQKKVLAQELNKKDEKNSEEKGREEQDKLKMDESWKKHLYPEFQKAYLIKLREFLVSEIKKKKQIYPLPSEYFEALNTTPFDKVKVVIVGQDPYHGPQQAHGLCFSVKPHVDIPPSLKNIFSELKKDLKIDYPCHGYLKHWADQGVLLLNSVLTVVEGQAGSHQNQGWEVFTDRILSILNEYRENIVFMLWGSYAMSKGSFLDTTRHLILKAPHPSPLSAHRGFFGCSHFSKTNAYLRQKGLNKIDWSLSSM